jgi:hypothetical protein
MSSDARRVVAPAPAAMASAAADDAQERRDDPGPDEELHPFRQTTVARCRQPLRAVSEELGELESRLELQGLVEERERGPTVTAGEGVKPRAIRATDRTQVVRRAHVLQELLDLRAWRDQRGGRRRAARPRAIDAEHPPVEIDRRATTRRRRERGADLECLVQAAVDRLLSPIEPSWKLGVKATPSTGSAELGKPNETAGVPVFRVDAGASWSAGRSCP